MLLLFYAWYIYKPGSAFPQCWHLNTEFLLNSRGTTWWNCEDILLLWTIHLFWVSFLSFTDYFCYVDNYVLSTLLLSRLFRWFQSVSGRCHLEARPLHHMPLLRWQRGMRGGALPSVFLLSPAFGCGRLLSYLWWWGDVSMFSLYNFLIFIKPVKYDQHRWVNLCLPKSLNLVLVISFTDRYTGLIYCVVTCNAKCHGRIVLFCLPFA